MKFFLGIALVALATRACAQSYKPAPLWGSLTPGNYGVGYKILYERDKSRTWTTTRHYSKPFSPDKDGRPLRLSIWYPTPPQSSQTMRFGDYFRGGKPPHGFEDVEAILKARDEGILQGFVGQKYSDLIAAPVAARLNATAAPGKFPLVLWFGGQGAPLYSGSVLAEYLASHGYVVVTALSFGVSADQGDLTLSPSDVAITVRDFQFAYSVASRLPDVDESRFAVMGHSIGATAALLFAMQNANVSAAIGLDGTYGFPNPPAEPGIRSITEGWNYAPRRMQCALLDLRRPPDDNSYQLDLSAVHGFVYSDRYEMTLKGMWHTSFTTEGPIAKLFAKAAPPDSAGRTSEAAAQGFVWSCQAVSAFLDSELRRSADGLVRLRKAAETNPRVTFAHEAARPVPPEPDECLDLVRKIGFEQTVRVIEEAQRADPTLTVVDEGTFNRLGYSLLEARKFSRAIDAFRLAAHFYPLSANALDSLGDAYAAAGQKQFAREAYARALELLPKDSSIAASDKAAFGAESARKLNALGT